MDKHILSVTGGSTRFISLIVPMIELNKQGVEITDIVCKSASAIAALPFVFGLHDELIEEGLNVTFDKMFTVNPVTRKGSISWRGLLRAISSFFTSTNSFGEQDVKPLIRKYVTEAMYKRYIKDDSLQAIHIVAVDANSKKPVVFNLKNISEYEDALSIIAGSSKISPFVKHEHYNGLDLIDGGMILSGAGAYLVDTGYFDVNTIKSMYSVYAWTNPFEPHDELWKSNIVKNIENSSKLFKSGGKLITPKYEYWYCKGNNIDLTQFHIPDVLDQLYDVDREDLEKAYEVTKEYTNNILKNKR